MSSTKSTKHLFLRPSYKMQMNKGSDGGEGGHLKSGFMIKNKQTNRIGSYDLVKNSCNIRQDVTNVPPSPPQPSKEKVTNKP